MKKTISGLSPYGRKTRTGFTIVELLIVIVVIAVLAAISVVAYNGVQNRANDTVIKNDLANFAKVIQLKYAETGEYPGGGRVYTAVDVDDGASIYTFPGVVFKPSKNAYITPVPGGMGLAYCKGPDEITGQPSFAILARSRSGQVFRWVLSKEVESLGSVTPNTTRTCNGFGYPRSVVYGLTGNNGWAGWIE